MNLTVKIVFKNIYRYLHKNAHYVDCVKPKTSLWGNHRIGIDSLYWLVTICDSTTCVEFHIPHYPVYLLFTFHYSPLLPWLPCLLDWTASTRSMWRSAWLQANVPKSLSSLLSTTRWKWNMLLSWWKVEEESNYLLLCLLLFPCSMYNFTTQFLKFLKPAFMSTTYKTIYSSQTLVWNILFCVLPYKIAVF